MRTVSFVALLIVASLPAPFARAELWVDQAAPDGGSGSAAAPFRSIAAAVKAAQPGDTITIRQGTYRESVGLSLSGTAEKPTVLRAAPGQRVILSGFAPIGDWKPAGDGIYTATVAGPVDDLYVGLKPQPVARWPDLDLPLRRLVDPDDKAHHFRDSESLPDEPFLRAVAAEPKSAQLFLYVSRGNYFTTIPLAGLDVATRTVSYAPSRGAAGLSGAAGRNQDRYQLANHPALIRKPGNWAWQAAGEKQVRVYFRPSAPADLAQTQYRQESRRVLLVGGRPQTTSYVRVEGLEICGAAGHGLQIERSDHVVVSHCILHSNRGSALSSRRSDNVELRNNICIANGGGIGIASAKNVLVEGNEVALNMVDGIDVAGNVTGRPGGEPETGGVILRGNYVHHHLFLSHPDNLQAYRWVRNFTIENNVLLFGGQALMTEEVDGATLRNCVAVGTGAVAVIFGHGNSHHWTVENCTVGLGGWGAFSLTGEGYRLKNNILWNNSLFLPPTLTSDFNLFYNVHDRQPVCGVSKPKWQTFVDVAAAAAATHQEQHSQRAQPAFRHAPYCQACAATKDSDRADHITLRLGNAADIDDFRPGDRVEINGDGVLRRITAVEAGGISFAPPLPRRLFRDGLVWNWKQADSTLLDLRPAAGSPALTAGEGGKPVGASLDIPAFQRGDFDGDGRRDIPELPDDLKAALPNPNDIVIPLTGA